MHGPSCDGKGLPSPRRWLAACCSLLALACPTLADAQAWVPGKGHGSVSVTAQHLLVKHHLDYRGNKFDGGRITSQSVYFNLDYGLTDRLAVTIGIPYIRKRYDGHAGHDPDPFNSPPGHDHDHADHEHTARLDDGEYHGSWQDLSVGVRYNWLDETWMVTPFARYNTPVRDYVYFAHAAVGTYQKRLELGVDVGRRFEPPAQDLYFAGGYGYSIVEEAVGIHSDYSTLNLELGYFLSPRWTIRGMLVARKTHGGLEYPIDFPRRDDELWFNHDRIVRSEYVELGVGVNWQANDHYILTGTVIHTVWGKNGHAADYALSLGITRGF